MLDRSTTSRPASYSYPQYSTQPQPKQYPAAHSTSSAFSASANPNEDWTKISDLAERRRIQNRIAQRNYRKKLKKRLEDLERRAGSSSASPEQRPQELPEGESMQSNKSTASSSARSRSSSIQIPRTRTPDVLGQHYQLPGDDRGMFSQQFTRQLSTSPPPFSYASMPLSTETTAFAASYNPPNSYCGLSTGSIDMPMYPQYLHPSQQTYGSVGANLAHTQIKQEFYGDDEMSPFSMSYASIAGVDSATAQSYQDVAPYTPPLSDSFDFSQAGSPPDELHAYPRTPASMPATPPLY